MLLKQLSHYSTLLSRASVGGERGAGGAARPIAIGVSTGAEQIPAIRWRGEHVVERELQRAQQFVLTHALVRPRRHI